MLFSDFYTKDGREEDFKDSPPVNIKNSAGYPDLPGLFIHSAYTYVNFRRPFRKIFHKIARILNVALPHDESLSRDPSGTLAWYDWRSAFFPKDRNHRAQVALWTLINTPFYGRVNVSRRSVQLMLPHSYSRSLCPKNIPRESSRKCNSPRRDFRRITDRSFSSLEIACGMVGRGIGWSSS